MTTTTMAEVVRERETEERIRAKDAADIVEEVHGLEDTVADLCDALEALKAVVVDDLLPIANEHGGDLWMPDALGIESVFMQVDAAIAKAKGES